MINAGDLITFRSLHADGKWYKRWQAMIESASESCIVTILSAGNEYDDVIRGRRTLKYKMRSFYWPDKFFNLDEEFDSDGKLVEVYLNVASPLITIGDELHYTDYELDVIKYPGQPAQIIDQDEFAEAITLYGYSPEFQAKCWQAAEEARLLAESWPKGR